MRRLLLSTKALWHQWRALQLARRALALQEVADAHAAEAAMSLLASRSLARGPLAEPTEPDQQPAGCSFASQVLLGSIVGLAIAFLWVWITGVTR